MNKPKKFKYLIITPNKKEDRFKFHEDFGYNQAIDKYNTWLKQSVSIEKITKIINDSFVEYGVEFLGYSCKLNKDITEENIVSILAEKIHNLTKQEEIR